MRVIRVSLVHMQLDNSNLNCTCFCYTIIVVIFSVKITVSWCLLLFQHEISLLSLFLFSFQTVNLFFFSPSSSSAFSFFHAHVMQLVLFSTFTVYLFSIICNFILNSNLFSCSLSLHYLRFAVFLPFPMLTHYHFHINFIQLIEWIKYQQISNTLP